MSFFDIFLVFSTAIVFFAIFKLSRLPSFRESLLTKVTEEDSNDLPKLENKGLVYTGCGVGIEAFGSPICAQAILPPITTISGFTPKKAGSHMTISARLPSVIEPIC